VVGVQLGGAIKNVMAIAAGISDGLGYGANARAALITRGLSELTRLGLAMGGKAETFMGLTGVGDLILTCTDNQSRNRRFGIGIGAGKSLEQVCEEIGQEIEGINTVRELTGISKKLHVDMPITEQVYRIIHHDTDPAAAVQLLLQRNPRAEST
jgi:glycerol-3-phosphate dehydrogenase (NAD(P)+)